MANTNTAPNVHTIGVHGVTIATVDPSETQREERRRETSRTRQVHLAAEARSTVKIAPKMQTKMSSSAEAPAPTEKLKTAFETHKEAYTDLESAVRQVAQQLRVKFKDKPNRENRKTELAPMSEELPKRAEDLVTRIDARIKTIEEKETPKPTDKRQLEQLKDLRDQVDDRLRNYEQVLANLPQSEPAVSAKTPSEAAVAPQAESEAEKNLWSSLQSSGVLKADGEKNLETLSEKIKTVKNYGEHLTEQVDVKAEELKAAADKLQKARTEEEKTKAKFQVEQLKKELEGLIVRKASLRQAVIKTEAIQDKIVQLQTKRELGLPLSESEAPFQKTQTVRMMQTASVKKDKTFASGYTQKGGKVSSPGAAALLNEMRFQPVSLKTASVSGFGKKDHDSPTVSVASAPMISANALNGNLLTIQSTTNNLRAEAQRTERLVKKLLKAAQSGNWEAVKSAMIYLDKRASQIVIGIGTQTIKAMQLYEQQMNQVTASIGKLKGGETDYQSRLAQLNSQMNLYSQNRSAISNFMRDCMSMRETIANETHSILQKDGQIASALAR